MKVTIEISLYPLYPDYKDRVIGFIKELNSYEHIDVLTNPMSTYVSGDYDEVMSIVPKAMKQCFSENETAAIIMKILPKDMEMSQGFLKF